MHLNTMLRQKVQRSSSGCCRRWMLLDSEIVQAFVSGPYVCDARCRAAGLRMSIGNSLLLVLLVASFVSAA